MAIVDFSIYSLGGSGGGSIKTATASVSNTTGTPAVNVTVDGRNIDFAFSGIKGEQGNTGSSVDYPYELVNNLTTNDATKGLSAAQGVSLEGEISQLSQEVDGINNTITGWQVGHNIYTNQGVGQVCPKTLRNSSSYQCVIVQVRPKVKYIVNGSAGDSPRLWCFLDSDDVILSVSDANASSTNNALVLTPPTGATQLIINSNTALDCYEYYKGLKDRVTKNETDISGLSQEVADIDQKMFVFTGLSSSPNNASSGITQIGDIFFRTTDKKFRKAISGSAGSWTTEEFCTPIEGAVYCLKGGTLYIWNGTDLVLADEKTRELFQHKFVYVASRATISYSGATITFGEGYIYAFNNAGTRLAKNMSGESYTLDSTDDTLVADWNNGATLTLLKQPRASLTNDQTVLAHYDSVTGIQPSALLGPFFLKNRIDSFDTDIATLKDASSVIRPFFESELETTAETITQKMAEPCLVFNVITDTHLYSGNSNNERRTRDSVNNIVALNRKVRSDGVIHLGDLLSVSMNNESSDVLYNAMAGYISSLYEANVDVYMAIGNHDGDNTNSFKPNRWFAISGRLEASYTTQPAAKVNGQGKVYRPAYYYKDFPDMNVRCIFLSVPESDEQYTYSFSATQLKWLAEDALNVTPGTQIIMFGHEAPFHGDVNVSQYSILLGICTAFHNKGTYTKTDSGYNISADYSGKTGSEIRAYFCGHSHFDHIAVPGWTYNGTYNGDPHTYKNEFSFPIVTIGAGLMTSTGSESYGGTAPSRTDKTVTQDLWDTIVYRPGVSKIYMVRFGAGEDREISI